MVTNGWLGAKSGQGFFQKQGKEILEIDPHTLAYSPAKKLQTPSIEMAKQTRGLANKVKTLTYAKIVQVSFYGEFLHLH
ncbi:3-hydroxyacyl-CoA dehydrogenase OS=Lysinibacillus sphaericus OX=1421 GN=LS41612_05070 PE=4 SV=1 [Lysinibacillus sphaericus]